MGRRGPRPQPTALKEQRGNPGNRRLNDAEPKPPTDVPRCPAWLTPEAKREWRAIVPLLVETGVLTAVDRNALAAYCQTYAGWRKNEEFLVKHGYVYPLRDERGKVKCMMQFPQVSIARQQLLLIKGYQQEFGLTPSSRTGIQVRPRMTTPAEREQADKRRAIVAKYLNQPRA